MRLLLNGSAAVLALASCAAAPSNYALPMPRPVGQELQPAALLPVAQDSKRGQPGATPLPMDDTTSPRALALALTGNGKIVHRAPSHVNDPVPLDCAGTHLSRGTQTAIRASGAHSSSWAGVRRSPALDH